MNWKQGLLLLLLLNGCADDEVEVLRDILRALAAPGGEAIDQLLLSLASKTEPGIYLEDLFHVPGCGP
jgi:hypothetical protein